MGKQLFIFDQHLFLKNVHQESFEEYDIRTNNLFRLTELDM